MEIKNYIFLTSEGYTIQPESDNSEPDINNLQVIGFSKGRNQDMAWAELLKENPYLIKSNFDEIFCYELRQNYNDTKKYYYLTDLKN